MITNPYNNGPNISESDRLISRIITAIQSERQSDEVPVKDLYRILDKSCPEEFREFFPTSYEVLCNRLKKMDVQGYVHFAEEDKPTVSTDIRGLISCGPIPIPAELVEGLEKNISETPKDE